MNIEKKIKQLEAKAERARIKYTDNQDKLDMILFTIAEDIEILKEQL